LVTSSVQRGAVGEQIGVRRRSGTEVLGVVENEQQLAWPQRSRQRLQ
jgi:hypothetical protein